MIIYVAHSRAFDYLKELYEPIRQSSLNNKYTFIFPHENENAVNSREFIQNKCNLIIAEVSHPSTGLGIELGWANMFNVPIKGIYRKESELPIEFRYVSQTLVQYKDKKDMISKIEKIIKESEKESRK